MRRTLALVAVVIAVAVLAGCGDDAEPVATDAPTTTADPVEPSTASSPFTVGAVPERYSVVAVGRGTAEGSWGEDCCGTDEPVTVLSPDGTPDHPDAVVVAATGFADYQGGLEQASVGYTTAAEAVEVDGDEAFFVTSDAGYGRAELVVARGDDLAVVVTAADAGFDELAAVAEATEVAEQGSAPVVEDPPEGLAVVGTATVDAVLARYPFVHDDPPGPASAHAVAWSTGPAADSDGLLVATLPGTAGDAAALAVSSGEAAVTDVEARTIAGRPAFVVDWSQYETAVRSVWLDAAWGDLVVVTASGADLPTADELVAIAASVQPTDPATWDAAVDAGTAPTA